MTTRLLSRTPVLKLGGSALADTVADALVSLEVRSSLHTASSVSARFSDLSYGIFDADTFKIGAELEVQLPGRSNSLATVFKGEITTVGIEHEWTQGATPMLIVEARDGSHRLAAASTFKAYLDQSRKTIVGEIAGRHGLQPKVVGAESEEPYLLQAGTDHAFLTELARSLGYEWFTDGKELHFRPRAETAGPTLKRSDGSLLRFAARYSATDSPSELKVLSWDAAQKQEVVGSAGSVLSGGATDLGSDAPFVAQQYGRGKSEFGQPLLVGELAPRSAQEADAVAAGLARELVGGGLRVEAVAVCNPDVRAGARVKVEEVGQKLSGSYYVTEVVHEFGPGQEVTTRIVSDGHKVEPPPWSPDGVGSWSTRGPVVGIVTNLNDPEKQGRVKVKFPSLGEQVESNWARVAAPGAGPERGLDARPEINDEVLVAFERGDARYPFVLGGLWNGKDAIPKEGLEDDGLLTSRVFVSRVGHTLEFSDGPSNTNAGDEKRHVTIVTGDGKAKLVVGEKGVTLDAGTSNPLTIKAGGASITLSDKGDVSIECEAFKVAAKKDAIVESKSGAVTVKGATGVKADGGSAFEAKGAQAKVEGQGMLTLKGGMVKIN